MGDLPILIVNENEKWQHTELLRLNEEHGDKGADGKCITEFINGYVFKYFKLFTAQIAFSFLQTMLALPYMLKM